MMLQTNLNRALPQQHLCLERRRWLFVGLLVGATARCDTQCVDEATKCPHHGILFFTDQPGVTGLAPIHRGCNEQKPTSFEFLFKYENGKSQSGQCKVLIITYRSPRNLAPLPSPRPLALAQGVISAPYPAVYTLFTPCVAAANNMDTCSRESSTPFNGPRQLLW